MSQNQTQTATATDFDLTPPDPVPTVAPEKAAGLVPVSDEVKSKLDAKVDGFVDDLVAQRIRVSAGEAGAAALALRGLDHPGFLDVFGLSEVAALALVAGLAAAAVMTMAGGRLSRGRASALSS